MSYLGMNPELIEQIKLYVHRKYRWRDHQRQWKVKHLKKDFSFEFESETKTD